MTSAALAPLDPCAPPDLRHLRRLTDAFGILQHTTGGTPAPEFGYAIDDVARALLVVTDTGRLFPEGEGAREGDPRTFTGLSETYLRFIEHCQMLGGRFHNCVAIGKDFRDAVGSGDSFGRTLWALGTAVVHGTAPEIQERAASLFRAALPAVRSPSDLRPKAFSLLGLVAVLPEGDPCGALPSARQLASELCRQYADVASETWPWFEETLTYANGMLPYALLVAAGHTQLQKNDEPLASEARAVGCRSLQFLLSVLPVGGIPAPIGNRWYPRGGPRSLYDQQCEDVAAVVLACAEAFRLTGDFAYREAAFTWWGWFFGGNTLGRALYRPEDGAVYDGLTPDGPNENRGAESVLSFLLAHLKLAEVFCR